MPRSLILLCIRRAGFTPLNSNHAGFGGTRLDIPRGGGTVTGARLSQRRIAACRCSCRGSKFWHGRFGRYPGLRQSTAPCRPCTGGRSSFLRSKRSRSLRRALGGSDRGSGSRCLLALTALGLSRLGRFRGLGGRWCRGGSANCVSIGEEQLVVHIHIPIPIIIRHGLLCDSRHSSSLTFCSNARFLFLFKSMALCFLLDKALSLCFLGGPPFLLSSALYCGMQTTKWIKT